MSASVGTTAISGIKFALVLKQASALKQAAACGLFWVAQHGLLSTKCVAQMAWHGLRGTSALGLMPGSQGLVRTELLGHDLVRLGSQSS